MEPVHTALSDLSRELERAILCVNQQVADEIASQEQVDRILRDLMAVNSQNPKLASLTSVQFRSLPTELIQPRPCDVPPYAYADAVRAVTRQWNAVVLENMKRDTKETWVFDDTDDWLAKHPAWKWSVPELDALDADGGLKVLRAGGR